MQGVSISPEEALKNLCRVTDGCKLNRQKHILLDISRQIISDCLRRLNELEKEKKLIENMIDKERKEDERIMKDIAYIEEQRKLRDSKPT